MEQHNGASRTLPLSLVLASTVNAEVAEIHVTQIDGRFGPYPEDFRKSCEIFNAI